MFADTYTVAGASEILGSSWSATDDNNDMTLVDGLYTLVKEDVELAANTYKYKVVKNHNWGTAGTDNWPVSDATLTITEDATYDITFTFNESTKAVNAVAKKKGEAVIEKHPLLVGDATIANGKSWDNTATENLMATADEGATYTLTVENAELMAGTNYGFKIVEQGTWTAYYKVPGNTDENAYLSVEESAVYTITFTFTVASSTCNVVTTKTGEAGAPTIKLHGTFTGSWADTDEFTGDDTSVSLTLTDLAEGTYEFGVKINGTWTSNGAAFTRANSAHVVEDGSGNLTLDVDQAGSYTFTWTYATNTLAVTYPTLLRKFFITGDSAFVVNAGLTVDKKWNPKAFKSEADSYTFKNLAAGIYAIKITIDGTWDTAKGYDDLSDKTDAGLTSNDGNISFRLLEPADVTVTYTADPAVFTVTTTGSFFKKEAGYYLIGEFSGVAGWAVENLVAEKKFTATVEEGQYSLLVTLAEGDLIKVVEVENNAIKTWYGSNNYEITDAYAGKKIIYFKPAGDGSWEQLDGHIWIGDDPTTALDEVEGGVKAVKRVVNGQLVIERAGKFYNALGAEVK